MSDYDPGDLTYAKLGKIELARNARKIMQELRDRLRQSREAWVPLRRDKLHALLDYVDCLDQATIDPLHEQIMQENFAERRAEHPAECSCSIWERIVDDPLCPVHGKPSGMTKRQFGYEETDGDP